MYEAYTLKTFHRTKVSVDSKDNLIQVTASSTGDFSTLYAGKYLGGIYCFFLNEGKIHYISAIDGNGKVSLSDCAPVLLQTCDNRDGSISIYHDDRYLSARKNGTFNFMPHNKEWEHIYLEKTSLETPPPPSRTFIKICF